MVITIHYDFTNGTELSYKEGCDAETRQESFTTNCLDFFATWTEADDVIIIDSEGNALSRKLLMTKGDTTYTDKDIREAHNLAKLFKANSFVWRNRTKVLNDYGWTTELADGVKKYGSVADIYLEYREELDYDEDGNPYQNGDGKVRDTIDAYMLVSDGNTLGDMFNNTFHIYCNPDLTSKIFEGHINDATQLKTVLEVLGFEKK